MQPYIKDPSKTIQDVVTELVVKTGENIIISRFARFELGK
jgi:elongation factor Ts